MIKNQLYFLSCFLLLGFSACDRKVEQSDERVAQPSLREVTIQTDWFPQAEHGGFYQALAKGFYKEAGLDVKILSGGPNAMTTQKVLRGTADFAMNRADTIYGLVQRDVPVTLVMATLQHDPQALLLHAENPIENLSELDGKRVMAIPGLMWVNWIQAKYDINIEIIPHDFGLERFINDPDFIQQCLLTNEPFYVQQQGVAVKVLSLSESGFDPYHGIYCLQSLIETDPGLVRDFVKASIRGWRDFIFNDPQPAFDLIAARNPKMTPDFLDFSYTTLKENDFVAPKNDPEKVGDLDPERLDSMVDEMKNLHLIESTKSPDHPWFTTRFLTESDYQ